MIKLFRGEKPEILSRNEWEWLQILRNEMSLGKTVNQTTVSSNYNSPEIKRTLADCSNQKCMYCESKIKHVDHGEIEHIKPKRFFVDLVFSWDNLGFTCSVCNKNKRDYYSATMPIIDPYAEDPGDHLIAIGSLVFSKNASDRGQVTQSKLDLNRLALVEQRENKIKEIQTAIDRFQRVTNKDVKDALFKELENFISDDSEYAFVSRAAYKALTE